MFSAASQECGDFWIWHKLFKFETCSWSMGAVSAQECQGTGEDDYTCTERWCKSHLDVCWGTRINGITWTDPSILVLP